MVLFERCNFVPKKMSLRYIFCVFAYFLLAGVEQLHAEDKSKTCHNSHIAVGLWMKEGLAVSNDDVYKDFRAVGEFEFIDAGLCSAY